MIDPVLHPAAVAEHFRTLALLWANAAEHSAEVAHARRHMFEAYCAEGFTEGQALELCKVIL